MINFFFVAMGDLLMTTTKNILKIIAFKLLFVLLTKEKYFSRVEKLRKTEVEEIVPNRDRINVKRLSSKSNQKN